jgi:diacylglycerol kinase
MKTAPPSRNRKSGHSRPRPDIPTGARASKDVAETTGGRPASHGEAASHERARSPLSPQGAARDHAGAERAESAVEEQETRISSAAIARHAADASNEYPVLAPSRAPFLRSFVYAWHGIVYTVHTQRNMRVHITLAVLAIALGIWLRISPVEFAMIFVAITGVVVSEMINTVAEACVDLATQAYHPLARVAKDVAAGAVLLSAMLAVVIACFVYIPHLWPFAQRLLGLP